MLLFMKEKKERNANKRFNFDRINCQIVYKQKKRKNRIMSRLENRTGVI